MGSTDYTYASAREIAGAVRLRDVSAAELTDAAIARIEKLDGELNAVVVRDFDRARADARAADEARAAGDSRPLLGVPVTVKESFDLTGYPTTWGMEPFRAHRAQGDATVVQRLKAAGAIVLGKTNVPPSLGDWQSDNPIYGRTNNPYDVTRSPGGSSGGSAASLAAGFAALEYGSDIGGSVRIPSAFCGVYGHKPSYGIVPLRGHSPGGLSGHSVPLAVAGPLARTAEDLELALRLTAGGDSYDPDVWRLELPKPRINGLKGARVLVLDRHPACATAAAMRDAIGRLADRLSDDGARVARESPLLPDLAAQHAAYFEMLMTIVSRGDPTAPPPPSAHRYMELLDAQVHYRRAWTALFDAFDIVVTPAFGSGAFPHTKGKWELRTMEIDGETTPYGSQLAWPAVAILANLPATAFPIGRDPNGMPLGAQAIGRFGDDYTTIAFAGLAGDRFSPPKL